MTSVSQLDHKALVKDLPTASGVYRMLSKDGSVLYVGKAQDLRKRVSSYFRKRGLSARLTSMMRLVTDIDVTVTHTEGEALLLENNLIKSLRPRYNVLLRDDKSYPYISLSTHDYPRLGFYRGSKQKGFRYFGPYPSASAVRETLSMLQTVFQIRQCEDSFFRYRSRPCLQYQIKRCSAPCVGLIDQKTYGEDIRHAAMFLEGRSLALVDEMVKRMDDASEQMDYEMAALYRDRIRSLRRIQEQQYVAQDAGDADVIAIAAGQDAACIQVNFIRDGHNLGDKAFYLKVATTTNPNEILAAFLPQYYLGKSMPPAVYLNRSIPSKVLLEEVFSKQAEKQISIATVTRGVVKGWMKMAETNAHEGLRRHLASQANLKQRFDALQEAFSLDAVPERIECFDVSHTFGESTVAACVVFDINGPVKSDYRRFNIDGVKAGDDYAAMEQALTRRYRRLKEGEGKLPDLLLIDGGKGQLAKAESAIEELQIEGIRFIAIAKGKERRPGKEKLFLTGSRDPFMLDPNSPAFHLIQQVRDEAHRFAITAHRLQRGKKRTTSRLEEIPGIGNKRRQTLLKKLGGIREVARAGVEDLSRVPGISLGLAQRIYDTFHQQEP
ncbi:MAG: excinuclease ABC subunit UvrC [Gammaproteobacteria bacterium]|jgi:excinuclease ABC subunit C|nr:excinuclease ABC subunit UvrC [Gammaproteobacteria bacterium]